MRMSAFKCLLAALLAAALAFSLTACFNRQEHAGPHESNLYSSLEASPAAKTVPLKADDAEPDQIDDSLDADNTEVLVEGEAGPDREPEVLAEGENASGSSGAQTGHSSASQDSGTNSNQGSGQSTNRNSNATSGQSSGSGSGNGSGANTNQNSSGGAGQTPPGNSNQGGSSQGNSSQNNAPRTITVAIEIDARTAHRADPAAVAGISHAGVILARRKVSLQEGATVVDALNASGVRSYIRGTGARAYVAGIGGLSEGDLRPSSGWMYFVNGQSSGVSAGSFQLNAGDVIAWRFTLDGGADIGASW